MRIICNLFSIIFRSDSTNNNPELINSNHTSDDSEFSFNFAPINALETNQIIANQLNELSRDSTVAKRKCLICLEDEKSGDIFQSCGHSSVCRECIRNSLDMAIADELQYKCPVCCQFVTSLQIIF